MGCCRLNTRREGTMPDDTTQPRWEHQPDGSRTKITNGIRITDRTRRRRAPIEHLLAHEEHGHAVIVGLDALCRPVYVTAFAR
jgi:hypothetical protein